MDLVLFISISSDTKVIMPVFELYCILFHIWTWKGREEVWLRFSGHQFLTDKHLET